MHARLKPAILTPTGCLGNNPPARRLGEHPGYSGGDNVPKPAHHAVIWSATAGACTLRDGAGILILGICAARLAGPHLAPPASVPAGEPA